MPDKTQVAAMDSSQRNSAKMIPDADSTLVMEPGANTCFWNGTEFAEGSLVESESVTYECSFGHWVKTN